MRQAALVPCLSALALAWTPGVPLRWKAPPPLRTSAGDTVWSFDTLERSTGGFPRLFPIREGGLSDLALDPEDPSGSSFWAVTDRGPVLALASRGKVLPLPDYHQKLVHLRASGDSLEVLAIDSIRDAAGRLSTGRASRLHFTGETLFPMPYPDSALAPAGGTSPLAVDSAGFDFEGIASDGNGGLILSDEMGPWIAHLPATSAKRDGTWAMDTVYRPGAGLPAVLARRDPNSGLEALCRTPGGKLVAVMQSPLPNAVAKKRRSDMLDSSRLHRIVVRSPGGAVSEYAYLNDTKAGRRAVANIKVGACSALDEDRIVVVEHGKTKNRAYQIDLWTVDLSAATDIHLEPDPDSLGRLVDGRTLEELAVDSAAFAARVVPVRKTLLLGDLYTYTAWPTTKPEGLAVVDDSTVALASDNDFGVQPVGDDGIPHVLDPDQRLPVLMYLRVKSMGVDGIRPRVPGRESPRMRACGGGWEILSSSGPVQVLDAAGRPVALVRMEGGRGIVPISRLPGGVLVLRSATGSALVPATR